MDNAGTKNVNPGGTGRALFILVPFLLLIVQIEYIWMIIFGANPDKYT